MTRTPPLKPAQKRTATDRGREAMRNAAKGLAMTAIDLLAIPDTLARAQAAFDEEMGRK